MSFYSLDASSRTTAPSCPPSPVQQENTERLAGHKRTADGELILNEIGHSVISGLGAIDSTEAIARRAPLRVARRHRAAQEEEAAPAWAQTQPAAESSCSSDACDSQPRKRRRQDRQLDDIVNLFGMATLETQESSNTPSNSIESSLTRLVITANAFIKSLGGVIADTPIPPCGTLQPGAAVKIVLGLSTTFPFVRPLVGGSLTHLLGAPSVGNQAFHDAVHDWLEDGVWLDKDAQPADHPADAVLSALEWFQGVAAAAEDLHYMALCKQQHALRRIELFWGTECHEEAVASWNDFINEANNWQQWNALESDNTILSLFDTLDEISTYHPEIWDKLNASSDQQLAELLAPCISTAHGLDRLSLRFNFWGYFKRVSDIPDLINELHANGLQLDEASKDFDLHQIISDISTWSEDVKDSINPAEWIPYFLDWMRQQNLFWYASDDSTQSTRAFRGHISMFPFEQTQKQLFTEFELYTIGLWKLEETTVFTAEEATFINTLVRRLAAKPQGEVPPKLRYDAYHAAIHVAVARGELDVALRVMNQFPQGMRFPEIIKQQLIMGCDEFIKSKGYSLEQAEAFLKMLMARTNRHPINAALKLTQLCIDQASIQGAREQLTKAESMLAELVPQNPNYPYYAFFIQQLHLRLTALERVAQA